MRILVLSFYYTPDLSAGSFRIAALVPCLLAAAPAGTTIDVLTTLPNRYHSFVAPAPLTESSGAVTVHRVALPTHRSGMVDQTRACLTFYVFAYRKTRGKEYDLVVATSSRLMTATFGAFLASRLRARLYLDIRDIFVDTIKEVAPSAMRSVVVRLFGLVERWTIQRANAVNLVSGGFAEYFRARYPLQRFSFFTNGVDEEFLSNAASAPSPARPPRSNDSPVTVVYAGNLGEGQGLHTILPKLARRLEGRVKFRIIGDGGRRGALVEAVQNAGVTNVEFIAPMMRGPLIAAYQDADVLFLHLNDYEAFKKVLPSKIFEYAATRKPIWAGVAGYAASFLRTEVPNAAVFPPGDVEAAVRAFGELALTETPRTSFLERFPRSKISREMAEHIVSVGGMKAATS